MSKKHIFICFLLMIAVSCGNKKQNNYQDPDFMSSLREVQIDGQYYISLPPDYSLTNTQGPDFIVYYFSPTDTTVKVDYSGGIYFGGHPSKFGTIGDSCSKEMMNYKTLGKNVDWDVYTCNDTIYLMETIIEDGDYQKIHAFGHARHKRNLYKLLDIYSTFRRKE